MKNTILRCRRLGLAKVEIILSLPDDAGFPQNCLDLALMTYVYHHVDNPVPFLKSLLGSLKPWGIVAMAEPKRVRRLGRPARPPRPDAGPQARMRGSALS